MKIEIESNIIKHYLKNVYFINGTAYAGKSTMCTLLAEKYHMIHCYENYHGKYADVIITLDKQPSMSFFNTMKSWQEFINRTPDEYESWINKGIEEAIGFEIVELINLSSMGKKIIVDTNIPVDVLHEISDYHHVAIMLSPQSLAVEKFFDRNDEDKNFVLDQINQADDPAKTLANFKACIARINCQKYHDEFAHSGFFTLNRENNEKDTRSENLAALEKHFKLIFEN